MSRLGLIGAHGTGKTTLASRLAKLLGPRVYVIPDVARLSPLPVGGASTMDAQQWIMDRQLHLERIFGASRDLVIYDGCSAGHLSYYRYWGGENLDVEVQALKSIAAFDGLLQLPARKEFLCTDGLRPTDVEFQRKIAEMQLETIQRSGIACERLPMEWPSWSDDYWLVFLRRAFPKLQAAPAVGQIQFAVAIGIVLHNGNVLLSRRHSPDIPAAHERWDLPGGKIEFGEDPETTVQREVLEETGYLVRPVRLLPKVMSNVWDRCNGTQENVLVLCYDCELTVDIRFPAGAPWEIEAVRWVSLAELPMLSTQIGVTAYIESAKAARQ